MLHLLQVQNKRREDNDMRYEKPEMELFEYEECDVIRTSDVIDNDVEDPNDSIEI